MNLSVPHTPLTDVLTLVAEGCADETKERCETLPGSSHVDSEKVPSQVSGVIAPRTSNQIVRGGGVTRISQLTNLTL